MHATTRLASDATVSSGITVPFPAHRTTKRIEETAKPADLRPAFSDAIAAASEELAIEIVTSAEQLLEVQRLRYRVYCEERGFLAGEDGIEQDRFDDHSRHVLVRSKLTGQVLGTVRLVLPTDRGGFADVPMAAVCDNNVFAALPRAAAAEVSRFALTRDRAGISPAAAALMRLCLVRGLIALSHEAGITHWCAVMEKTLLRLLRATAIHFQPVGPAVEFHGLRQPVVGSIDAILARMQGEQPATWAYLTGNGTLWPALEAPMQQAA